MAPHLTGAELDLIHKETALGKAPSDIQERIGQRRRRSGKAAPNITNVRKAMRGKSHRQGVKEARGRKRKLTHRWVCKMNTTRKGLLARADGCYEVRWKDVLTKSRAPKVHRSTLKRSFDRSGIPVQARRPREKPQRTAEHAKARVQHCEKWGAKPPSYYEKTIDMLIDNKSFDVPTTKRGAQHVAKQRVRFHLRTPGEGLQPSCTRPGRKKNRMNVGGTVSVCAGVSNGRIVMWRYLPKAWNAKEAVALYRGPILNALKKHRGVKSSYTILEDNDPAGYICGKAVSEKKMLRVRAIPWPKYSPDLRPLDFSPSGARLSAAWQRKRQPSPRTRAPSRNACGASP